jgi:hypothetical protein
MVGGVEVLIRYRCQGYHQPDVRCPDCNGKGYLELWVPHFLLRDSSVRFKDVPFVIKGYRETHDHSPAYPD